MVSVANPPPEKVGIGGQFKRRGRKCKQEAQGPHRSPERNQHPKQQTNWSKGIIIQARWLKKSLLSPLKKGHGLSFKKNLNPLFDLPKDALCQVWLNLHWPCGVGD